MRILLVGDHPMLCSGNGNMMSAILGQLSNTLHHLVGFAIGDAHPSSYDQFAMPIHFVRATLEGDLTGSHRLLDLLQGSEIDILAMIGIDIWTYAPIFDDLQALRKQKGFTWIHLFPYDLQHFRQDWVDWINIIDYPLVYSEYGYNMLKDAVPRIQYFRPPLYRSELFTPGESERRQLVGGLPIPDDQVIFGYVGKNLMRKDLPSLIKGFSLAKAENPHMILYLHTNPEGKQNVNQLVIDYGLKTGDVYTKPVHNLSWEAMAKVYRSLDCLVNCTMQEGLSWTPLEAMLSGCPVIASNSTAHVELVKGAGMLVPCDQPAQVLMHGKKGPSFIDALKCSPENIAEAILKVAGDKKLRKRMSTKGIKRGREWLAGVSDFGAFLSVVEKERTKPIVFTEHKRKRQAVLFMQHSSAGDVLMSTQCFKGLKERHSNMPLVYMTQRQFQDIVLGNPYVDEIIDWDLSVVDGYEIVYNPHGEKILPGGWNNLDVKLYSMYPYFCDVEADKMYINQVDPMCSELPDNYILIHTSGGVGRYRTYVHMDHVVKKAKKKYQGSFVQIGGTSDFPCHAVDLDLRGKLSFQESAWLMARADCAVVIDSFPAHLAGALDTPAVVLFGPAPARVTGPIGSNHVCLQPDMLKVCDILSHCWGNPPPGMKPCTSPCINTISPLKVVQAISFLLEKNRDRYNEVS